MEKIADLRSLVERLAELEKIINDYRDEPGSLIMTVRKIQDLFGYVPGSALRILSEKAKIPLTELGSIVSFYHLFSTTPKGKYDIKVCMGTSCYVRGGRRILDFLRKEMDLEPGRTSEDSKFSVEVIRCFGCCGLSPVVAIGERVYTRTTPNRMRRVLEQYD